MSRPGITKQEVYSAANQILGQGKDPTIEQIRHILKTGSNSTIAVHLRDWRANQSGAQTLALNEGLPHDIVAIVKALWDKLSSQAVQKVDEVETSALQTITELQLSLQKYKTNNQRWQRLFTAWQHQKERLMAEKLVMEHTIESLQLKNKILTEQLQEKRMRIEELHRLHMQAQENFEHMRESFLEERTRKERQYDKLKDTYDQKITQLIESEAAVKATQLQLVDLKLDLKAVYDKNKMLEQEKWQLHQEVNRLQQLQISS